MDAVQNRNDLLPSTEIIEPISTAWENLTWQQQYWVNFRACNGIRFTEDGDATRMTVASCASWLGVGVQTLYDWQNRIPRFAELKAWRRQQLYGDKVVDKTWSAVAMKAALGEFQHADLILRNFDPNYKSPKQTQELEVGDNMAEIFNLMRQKAQVIDGEYSEPDPTTEALASGE